jgi:hypothetical protein
MYVYIYTYTDILRVPGYRNSKILCSLAEQQEQEEEGEKEASGRLFPHCLPAPLLHLLKHHAL